MKTKLEIIQESLAGNPDIAVVATQHHCSGCGGPPFEHAVRICVVPKSGIYDPEALNAFMMGLIPGLKPTMVDEIYINMGFRVGKLYFDEVFTVSGVGLCDDGAPSVPVKRRTWVAVYPDRILAHSGADGIYRHDMPLSVVNESTRRRALLLAEALGIP